MPRTNSPLRIIPSWFANHRGRPRDRLFFLPAPQFAKVKRQGIRFDPTLSARGLTGSHTNSLANAVKQALKGASPPSWLQNLPGSSLDGELAGDTAHVPNDLVVVHQAPQVQPDSSYSGIGVHIR